MKKNVCLFLCFVCLVFLSVTVFGQEIQRPLASQTVRSVNTCISCSITNPNNSFDGNVLTFSTYDVSVGLIDGFIGQQFTFGSIACKNDTVFVIIPNFGNLPDSILANVRIQSYKNGTPNSDMVNLQRRLLTPLNNQQFAVLKFAPGSTYNQIRLTLASRNASLFSKLDVYDVSRRIDVPIVVKGSTSLCQGDSTILDIASDRIIKNPSEDVSYNWYSDANGDSLIFLGNTDFKVPPLFSDTTFYVKKCSDGYLQPITIRVFQRPSIPTITGEMVICKGSSTILTANVTDGSIVHWVDRETGIESFGNSFTLNNVANSKYVYFETIIGSCKSLSFDSVFIEVIPPLLAPIVECGTPSITSVTFQWSPVVGAIGYQVSTNGGVNFTSVGTDLSVTYNNLVLGQTVTIIVQAIGVAPCFNSPLSFAVTCVATACKPISFDDPKVFTACKGSFTTLRIENINAKNFEVSWNGGPFEKDSTKNFQVFSDGVVTAEVRNADQPGCPTMKKNINVIATEIPSPRFTSDKRIVTVPNGAVQFFDETEGAVSRLWDFGDGNTSNEQYPIHRYDSVKKYTVSLQVTNENGCNNSLQVVDYIEGKFAPIINIPNVFSPNNDGLNDQLEVKSQRIIDKGYQLTLYSPNGQKVFETLNLKEYWDGKFDGTDMPVGAYFYTLTAIADDNQKFEMKGVVNLIR